MKRKIASVLVSIIGLGSGACALDQKRWAATTMGALAGGKGIVVISTSAAARCPFHYSFVTLVRHGKHFGGWDAGISLDGGRDSDFADRFGRVDAFVLDPGDYWVQLRPSIGMYYGSKLSSFRLAPGEIRYVGNLHGSGCGNLVRGADLLVEIGNEWNRVRPRFIQRFPTLDPHRVKVELFSRLPRHKLVWDSL